MYCVSYNASFQQFSTTNIVCKRERTYSRSLKSLVIVKVSQSMSRKIQSLWNKIKSLKKIKFFTPQSSSCMLKGRDEQKY